MIERQIDNPMPIPLDLLVTKAPISRSAFSAAIPTPLSITVIDTFPALSWHDRITSPRIRHGIHHRSRILSAVVTGSFAAVSLGFLAGTVSPS
jgi:hypothetical protein